jgi:dienelactone hydrolase
VIAAVGVGTMLRVLFTLMIGIMLAFAVPTGAEACSYDCNKEELAKDLKFTLGGPSITFSGGANGNRLILPITDGNKIGAVVLLPSCGGITPKSKGDLQRWGDLLLKNGYAVVLIDHYTSRGVKSNCSGPSKPIKYDRLSRDVADALALIHQQTAIDKSRIFTLGFSLGAMTGAELAGKYSWNADDVPKPRAVAGLYGGCANDKPSLNPDANIPILWLVGGKDLECPPKPCRFYIKLIQEKGLMTYHEYPNASHCWDCSELSGFTRIVANGKKVTYQYDRSVTKDSEQRVLNFFNSFQSQ